MRAIWAGRSQSLMINRAATSILAGRCDSKLVRKYSRQKNEGRRIENEFVLTFASYASLREPLAFEVFFLSSAQRATHATLLFTTQGAISLQSKACIYNGARVGLASSVENNIISWPYDIVPFVTISTV